MATEAFVAGREHTWAARQFGERTALVAGELSYSFRHVNGRANRLANALRGVGATTNDRVAVLLHNGVQSMETLIGVSKAGLTYVALNTRHAVPEHLEICRDCRPHVIIAGPEFEETITTLVEGLEPKPLVVGLGWRWRGRDDYETFLSRAADSEPGILVAPSDVQRLQYTSGTTGRAKGVAYSHAEYYARLHNFFTALEYRLGVDDSMIHVAPLTHVAGVYAIPYWIRGARGIIMPHYDSEAFLRAIERERVTHLLLVPTMITRLVELYDPARYNLSSVARINYGTAPLPRPVLERAMDKFGPIFRQQYGLSEAPQPICILYPHEHVLTGRPEEVARLAACGRPSINVDLVLRGDDDAPVATGEVGEITIRAVGTAATYYWEKPEQTAETYRGGWLHTGDLGRMDEDGYLYVVGRKKDMIISGGFNVYAREVEEALHQHPAVFEAAVFGVPDAEWGEAICAVVALRDGQHSDAENLVRHCRTLIAGYKRPRHLDIVEQIPKNQSGKIDKGVIRREFVRRRFGDESDLMSAVLARY